MNAVFQINQHSDVLKVHNFLAQHQMSAVADGKPLIVRISDKQETRTKAQNRLYWLWLSDFAKHTGNDEETLHFEFKYRFLIFIYMRDDPDFNEMALSIANLKDVLGETEQYKVIRDCVIKQTSTTKANTKQMTEYLNRIYDYCLVKHGFKMKIPDDLKWCYDGER